MDRTGAILVLLATAGLALKGIWARLAYAEGLDVPGVLFYRSAFSVPLVVLTAVVFLRRTGTAGLRFSDYVPGILLGAMFSLGMACDFQAIALLGASVSRVILFGFPGVVMLLTAAETRTLPSGRKIAGFALAWLGLLCVASPSLSADGRSLFGPTGLVWGLASLVFYAIYVWVSGKLSRKLGSVRFTSVSNLSTAAVVLGVVLLSPGGEMPPASTTALGWIALMVVLSTVFPYFLLMEGIRRLGSSAASLLSMSGPVVTVFAGVWFLGESLSSLQVVGTALTILGVGFAEGVLSQMPKRAPGTSTVFPPEEESAENEHSPSASASECQNRRDKSRSVECSPQTIRNCP